PPQPEDAAAQRQSKASVTSGLERIAYRLLVVVAAPGTKADPPRARVYRAGGRKTSRARRVSAGSCHDEWKTNAYRSPSRERCSADHASPAESQPPVQRRWATGW